MICNSKCNTLKEKALELFNPNTNITLSEPLKNSFFANMQYRLLFSNLQYRLGKHDQLAFCFYGLPEGRMTRTYIFQAHNGALRTVCTEGGCVFGA